MFIKRKTVPCAIVTTSGNGKKAHYEPKTFGLVKI